jgi:hypothetical protein
MKFLFNLFKAKAAQVGEKRKWKIGMFEKQTGGKWTRVEAQKHLNAALAQHNLDPKDISKETMNETHEDIEAFHKKVHLGGQSKAEFWGDWAKKYGGAPASAHKSVVHSAHERIIQAHGVPNPAQRTKQRNKAEEAGEPAPKFVVKPKEKEKQEPVKEVAAPRKTFKVSPKIKPHGKMIDPIGEGKNHTNRFVVEGDSGKDYVIGQHKASGKWTCECPACKYHGGTCKHLDRHLDELKQMVKEGAKPTKRGMERYEKVKIHRDDQLMRNPDDARQILPFKGHSREEVKNATEYAKTHKFAAGEKINPLLRHYISKYNILPEHVARLADDESHENPEDAYLHHHFAHQAAGNFGQGYYGGEAGDQNSMEALHKYMAQKLKKHISDNDIKSAKKFVGNNSWDSVTNVPDSMDDSEPLEFTPFREGAKAKATSHDNEVESRNSQKPVSNAKYVVKKPVQEEVKTSKTGDITKHPEYQKLKDMYEDRTVMRPNSTMSDMNRYNREGTAIFELEWKIGKETGNTQANVRSKMQGK